MVWSPQVRRVAREGAGADVYVVGHPLVDEFLEFAAGRARPNTVRAYAHDLKAFFTVVAQGSRSMSAPRMCSASSRLSAALGSAPRTWCGSPMAARGCRAPRFGVGWRRCPPSTAI